MRKLVMGIADATMSVDGRLIYQAKDLKGRAYLLKQIISKKEQSIEKSCCNRYGYCFELRQ